MTNKQTWYRASTGDTMVRCECWRHLLSVDENGNWGAPNNGWYPETQPYPHGPHCDQRER